MMRRHSIDDSMAWDPNAEIGNRVAHLWHATFGESGMNVGWKNQPKSTEWIADIIRDCEDYVGASGEDLEDAAAEVADRACTITSELPGILAELPVEEVEDYLEDFGSTTWSEKTVEVAWQIARALAATYLEGPR